MRKGLIFALAFLLLLPLAKADTYLTDCATLDTPGETYYLTQDIINSTASTCMNIIAGNIVLDCQGHIIDGIDASLSFGIYAAAVSSITIKNCVVTDWNYGIHLNSVSYSNLSNITANYNSDDGIYIYFSNSNNLSNITANFNTVGLLFGASNSNNLSNITANFNTAGLLLWVSYSNTVKNSRFQGNMYGIYIYAEITPIPNLIYNNLFNNTNNFYFDGTIYANYWNTTRQAGTRIYSAGTEIGGNYWTNPEGTGYSDTCTDADKDGFCDDPYVLTTDNVDYLPLSNQYSPTTTTLLPVHGVPLLSSTLVGIVIGSGIIIFMLRTLFDIREPKKIIEYFIALAVIVLTVLSLIALFA